MRIASIEVNRDSLLRFNLVLPHDVCALVSDLLEDLRVELDLAEVVSLDDAVDLRQVLGHLGGLLLEMVGGHVRLDLLVEVEEHEVVDHGVLESVEAVLEAVGDPVRLLVLGSQLLKGRVLCVESQLLDFLL